MSDAYTELLKAIRDALDITDTSTLPGRAATVRCVVEFVADGDWPPGMAAEQLRKIETAAAEIKSERAGEQP